MSIRITSGPARTVQDTMKGPKMRILFWIECVRLLWPALKLVAGVIKFGASKHADHGWVDVTEKYHYAACCRHLAKAGDDPESGFPHFAHAACRLLFILSKKR